MCCLRFSVREEHVMCPSTYRLSTCLSLSMVDCLPAEEVVLPSIGGHMKYSFGHTNEWIFMEFSGEIMPLEPSPLKYSLIPNELTELVYKKSCSEADNHRAREILPTFHWTQSFLTMFKKKSAIGVCPKSEDSSSHNHAFPLWYTLILILLFLPMKSFPKWSLAFRSD